MIRHRIIADLCEHAMSRINLVMNHGTSLLDNQLESTTFAFIVVMRMIEALGEFIGEGNEDYATLRDEEKLVVMSVLLRQFATYKAGTFDAEKLKAIILDMHLTIKALPDVR